ncbi:hypothetical protein PbDSM24746_19990 [Paenibacillus macerans]|nr:hypothetical protein PbDSM24746_19990 [Paenibacillus macerans]GBK68303.1 hypothetical protein PbJCM17693_20110 [Paenibacillus macerans]
MNSELIQFANEINVEFDIDLNANPFELEFNDYSSPSKAWTSDNTTYTLGHSPLDSPEAFRRIAIY